jgi:spore coat polysaccharide biosynthesis protein SpsF (cytidylyltransferase family)
MTGLFIVARLGSTRLNQKHLIQVAGKTFIEWLAARYLNAFQKEIKEKTVGIFIVTSEKEENKKFEELFPRGSDVTVFYGADNNIPLRQLQCARAHGITRVINIDGDDVLCSTEAARIVNERLLGGAAYCKTKGLPLGMNVLGYQADCLSRAVKQHEGGTLETGWGRIFDEDPMEEISLGTYDSDDRWRMTLDYKEDADFFAAVIEGLSDKIIQMDDRSLIKYIEEKKFYEINQHLNNEYWKNFDLQKNAEL